MAADVVLKMEPAESCADLWSAYFGALGPKRMRDCFGWDEPPKEPRWGESVWVFKAHGRRVAWSSVTRYPKEPSIFELALGVWPRHQGRGYRGQILDMTATAAFEDLKAEEVVMLVLDSCHRHQVQCLRDAQEHRTPWVHSGVVWYPDPYMTFTLTRDAWVASRRK